MKKPASLALVFALVSFSPAAKPPPEPVSDIPLFQGMVADSRQPQFGLTSPDGTRNAWLRVGQNFDGWKLAAYDKENDCLVVTKNGREERIPIDSGNSGIVATKATRADAEAAIKAMKIGKLTGAILEQQKHMISRMVKSELAKAGLTNPTPGQVAAAEKIAMEQVRSEFSGEKMREAFTGVFAEVYSKEELQAQTRFFGSEDGRKVFSSIGTAPGNVRDAMDVFYSTPAGKNVKAKQRLLNQKTMEVLAPRAASVQVKTTKAIQDYAATQR